MTRFITHLQRAALAAAIVAAAIQPASAQQRAATIIGIVDADRLLAESLAAKGVRLEREKYATTY